MLKYYKSHLHDTYIPELKKSLKGFDNAPHQELRELCDLCMKSNSGNNKNFKLDEKLVIKAHAARNNTTIRDFLDKDHKSKDL